MLNVITKLLRIYLDQGERMIDNKKVGENLREERNWWERVQLWQRDKRGREREKNGRDLGIEYVFFFFNSFLISNVIVLFLLFL